MKLTPEEFATLLTEAKPYIAAIEERTNGVAYGTIDATITVRAGEVEKMEFHEHKVWLKPKP